MPKSEAIWRSHKGYRNGDQAAAAVIEKKKTTAAAIKRVHPHYNVWEEA